MVRFKHRYILCEIKLSSKKHVTFDITKQAVYNMIRNAITDMYGDYGMGILLASLNVRYANPQTQTVIIRAKRGCQQMVMAAMATIHQTKLKGTKGEKQDLFFNTLHISGTIRSCQKFLVKHHQQQLRLLLKECKNEDERTKLRQSLSEVPLVNESVKDEHVHVDSDDSSS